MHIEYNEKLELIFSEISLENENIGQKTDETLNMLNQMIEKLKLIEEWEKIFKEEKNGIVF